MDAYLSMIPEQRSSVKSQYHCATLVGNWEEERNDFGPQSTCRDADGNFACTTIAQPPTSGGPVLPIDPNTMYTTSYKDLTPAQREASKPSGSLVAEAPRELLFYHGDLAKPTDKNLLTINEMSYTNHTTQAPHTNEEILDLHGVSTRRDKTATLRRTMGLAASPTVANGSRNGTAKKEGEEEEENSAAIERESAFLRSLVQPDVNHRSSSLSSSSPTGTTVITGDGECHPSSDTGYTAPRLPPVGRVASRDALLTTKNVTIDATGEHLYTDLSAYPLTSSVSVGQMMASKNNPMHKTQLRVEYELTR